MPVFRVTETTEEVTFRADEDAKLFLKPEEIGLAVVSENLDFDYEGCCRVWPGFGKSVKQLVAQTQEGQGLGLAVQLMSEKEEYCIILCRDAQGQPETFKSDDEDKDLIQLKVKIRLISQSPLEYSRQQREECCLVQLARLCGPQNVSIQMTGLGGSTEFPWMQQPCDLVWNEEDLSWEADTTVILEREELDTFGNEGNSFEVTVKEIRSKMEDEGVRNVLRSLYGGPGDQWKLQKQILEEGAFSDLVVVSGNPRDKEDPRLFQCHTVKLSESSQVFADMLQGNWTEAQKRTIKLPESEDAIEAMLHFIYYGGTDRIYRTRLDLVLELLQAGHKYNLEKLVEVAVFVLLSDDGKGTWLTVEAALETFSFARCVEGYLWTMLRERCFLTIWMRSSTERMRSRGWRKLCRIAKKLGPGFGSLLDHLHPEKKFRRKYLPGSLMAGVKGVTIVTKEEAELIYDFLMSEPGFVSCDSAVGLFMLAEYLGKPVKEVEDKLKLNGYEMNLRWPLRFYRVDYLVDMFCLARQKEGSFWMRLKMGAVRKLKEFEDKQGKNMEEYLKFKELVEGKEGLTEEWSSLKAALELKGEDEICGCRDCQKERFFFKE